MTNDHRYGSRIPNFKFPDLKEILKNKYGALGAGAVFGFLALFIFYQIFGNSVFLTNSHPIEPTLFAIYLPISLVYIISINYFAGWLKLKKEVKTGYTRKLIHISNFTFLTALTLFEGYSATFIFGAVSILFRVSIIIAGDGNIFYEAWARERDAPYRACFLIFPSIAAMIGILFARAFFGPLSIISYLVLGFGDAVGEPVGTRFGKHRYNVPSFSGMRSTRSIEGSFAVFTVAVMMTVLPLVFIFQIGYPTAVLVGLCTGLGVALIEAVSPHGFDNLTIPIAAGYLTFLTV